MVDALCNFESAVQTEFCRLYSPEGRKAALAQYIEAKSKCDWKEDSAKDAPHNMSVRAAAWSNSSSYEHALSVSPPDTSQANELTQKLQLHTCRVDVADATHWQVMRLGPFVTNGGWDWIETNIDNALYSESRDAFVTAALMAPVFANGTLIGYPPLHVHHMHLTQTYQSYVQAASKNGATSLFYQATPPFIVDEYTFHMHGDSPCTEDDGGTACYLMPLPSEYGIRFPTEDSMYFNAEINDVRRPQSPALEWWLEFSIKISTADLIPVSKLFASGVIGRYPGLSATAAQARQGLVMLPGDMRDAMAFYSFPMHQAGQFLHLGTGLSHAHQAYNKGYIIFTGRPADGGLHALLSAGGAADEMVILDRLNLTIQGVVSHVRRHLTRQAEKCAAFGNCSYVPRYRCHGGPGLEFVDEDVRAGIDAGYYDRMASPMCATSQWSYRAGEVFTVVSFLGRVFPNDTHYPLPYGMHPFSFGAIVIDDHVLKDRHDLSVYQQNYRYHCMKNEPETTFNTWTDQTILRGGGEAAAGGCIDDDALAAERASAYGVSIGGCAEGKSMGLCQFPEGREMCPLTCGTCGGPKPQHVPQLAAVGAALLMVVGCWVGFCARKRRITAFDPARTTTQDFLSLPRAEVETAVAELAVKVKEHEMLLTRVA